MRNVLIFFIFLFALSCSQQVPESKSQGTMAGVYTLQYTTFTGDNRDTIFPAEYQSKIYTDKHFIYGTIKPDSIVSLGFGTYILSDSTIIERNIFHSFTPDTASETKLKVSRSSSAYTRIQYGVMVQGLPSDVSEAYKKMPDAKPSDLDGAWELQRFENVTGPDTTTIKIKQYKVYQDGHFMWIHRYSSDFPNKQFQTGYGFGVFNIKDKIVTETIISSNYKEIIEVPISVSFSLNGKDELLLSIIDGISITTETYHRVN